MTSWLWDRWDQAGDWWTGLGARLQTAVAAGLAWVLVAVVAIAPLAPLLPEAAEPPTFDPLPPPAFEASPLSAPTTTSNLRFDGEQMVLSARGTDGAWVPVLEAPPEQLPGQFAKMTATSPDRRHVVYVTAADLLLNDAVLHLAEASTGRVRELATIPSGLFPSTPVWSPDASRVAILRHADDGAGLDLWTIHVATGEQVRVPAEAPVPPEAFYGADQTPLVWSDDGERLAYEIPDPSAGTSVREEVAVADGRTDRTTAVLPPKSVCEVPVFSQNDPRWSDQRMREQGDTIGAAGCALTAAAMVLNYYGADLDPTALNDCLQTAAQPLYWGAATAPDCAGERVDLENFVAFSWETLSGLMAQGRPAILGFAGGPTGSHYVVVTSGSGVDGANYAIHDPWDGTTWKTIDYYALKGYSPERLVVFRGDENHCASRAGRDPNLAAEPQIDGAPTGVEGTLEWRSLIEQVAREEDVDPDVVQAVMAIKSGGNALAIGPDTPLHGAAMGLMQVQSGIAWHWDPVAERLGHRPSPDEMLVPEHNIRAGAYELATRHALGGNWSDWLICAVGYFGGATEDGQIADAEDAGGIDGWTYYDRVRANVVWIRDHYGRGGLLPPPPDEVSRPPDWPGVGTLETIVGGPVSISQGFGYTGFTPSPGAYDYSVTLGLNAGDHAAVDISLVRGAPLYAAMDAVVITAGGTPFFRDDLNPSAGELKFRLANGVEIIYGHTAEIYVGSGTMVSPGQQVALTGQAGTGSHLHLEVRVPDASTSSGMRAVDPQVFFSGKGGGGAMAGGGAIGGARTNWPTAEAIDARIAMSEQQNGRNSFLHGTGLTFLEMGAKYGVNPGFVIAMLQKESQLGADGSPLPTTANNFGGITNEGNCGKHWIDFADYADRYFAKYCSTRDGIEANFEIFTQQQYRRTNGTIGAVLEVYSPSYENNNRAAMATIQAVGSQLNIELSVSTNIYGGAPGPAYAFGGGSPPTAPPTGPPPVWNAVPPPTVPPSPPAVRIVGIEDLASYAQPVKVEAVELIFPVDPDAPVQLSVPIGTVFDKEGRSAIDVTVLSPHLPGGVAKSTITFTIDFTPPTTRVEVLGIPIDPPPTATVAAPADTAGEVPVIGADPRLADTSAPAPITYRNEALIAFSAEDALSQIRAILYQLDGEAWLYYTTSGPPRPISIRLEGCHTVAYLAIDAAGNKESAKSVDLCIELTETAPADLTATAVAAQSATAQLATEQAATEQAAMAQTATEQAAMTQTAAAQATAGTPQTETPPDPTATDTPEVTVDAGSPTATITPVIIDLATVPPTATPEPATATVLPEPATPTETPDPAATPTETPDPAASPPTDTPVVTPSPGSPTAVVTETATVVDDGATPGGGSPVPSATTPLDPDASPQATATVTAAATEVASPEATLPPTPPPTPPTDDGTPATDETATAGAGDTPTAAPTEPDTSSSTPVLPPGDLEVIFEDEGAQPILDACVLVTAIDGSQHPFCDRDDGESDGTTRVHDLPGGSATVAIAGVPTGYSAEDPKQVVIGQDTVTRFVGRRTAGSLRVTTLDEAGQLVAGSCYQIIGADGRDHGQFCDDVPGDGDPAPGVVLVEGIAVGDARLRQTRAAAGYVLAEERTVPIPSAETGATEVTNVRRAGSLRISSVDQTSQLLAGACFTLLRPDGQRTASVCDDDGLLDRQPEAGVILLEDLPLGPLTIRQDVPPAGFPRAADQPAIVEEGPPKEVTIAHAARFQLTIRRTDADGNPLSGSCFAVYPVVEGADGALAGSICDDADTALDGQATLPDLLAGDYRVVETLAPAGSPPAEPVLVSIGAELPNVVEVQGSREVGTLTIHRTDVDGVTTLPGSCFDVYTAAFGAAVDHVAGRCDAEDGEDGRTIFENLTVGDYVVQEYQAPTGGFQLAAPAIAGVVEESADGAGEEFLVIGGRLTGSLTVLRIDAAGAPQPGSCFDVYTYVDGNPIDHVAGPCDGADGVPDGRTEVPDLDPGEYLVVETQRLLGADPGDPRRAVVAPGQATQVVVAAVPVVPTEEPTAEPVPTPEIDLTTEPGPTATEIPTATTAEPLTTETPTGETPTGETPIGETPIGETATTEPVVTAEPTADTSGLPPGGGAPTFPLTIRRVNEAGELLPGSCFSVHAVDRINLSITGGCDGDDGAKDGITVLDPIPAGDYEIVEIGPPTGYTELVAVYPLPGWAGDPSELPISSAEATASLTIVRLDAAGQPVTGVCFDIFSATAEGRAGGFVRKACDGEDGPQDGTTTTTLALGNYLVADTSPAQVAPVPATVTADGPNRVTVGETPTPTPTPEPTATLVPEVPTNTPVPPPDSDGDGFEDSLDNCPAAANPDQANTYGSGLGDACEAPPPPDGDLDGVADAADNCPLVANPDQANTYGDLPGDACEAAPAPVDTPPPAPA